MSVATLPRSTETIPYAESQPQRAIRHASPDWLPVIGWFVDDGLRHSRINVVPLANTVDPTERFAATLKFFRGGEQPVHTFISEPFAGDQVFRFESTDLLKTMGESTFEGLVEITARSLDNPPSHFPWVDSWLEFSADDGSLQCTTQLARHLLELFLALVVEQMRRLRILDVRLDHANVVGNVTIGREHIKQKLNFKSSSELLRFAFQFTMKDR